MHLRGLLKKKLVPNVSNCFPDIISITMLQNEADIVEYFIRTNTRFIDLMVIMVNPSLDGTSEILDQLISEGYPIIKWNRPINYYSQTKLLSWMAYYIRDMFFASTILFLDADEIILCRSKKEFKEELNAIPKGHVGEIPWQTFIPPKNSIRSILEPKKWKNCLNQEIEQYFKIALPSTTAVSESDCISQGAHFALSSDRSIIPSQRLRKIAIAHLPIRSSRQVKHKIYGGLLCKTITNSNFWNTGETYHWQNIEMLINGKTNLDIQLLSKQYLITNLELKKEEGLGDIKTRIVDLPKENIKYKKLVRNIDSEELLYRRIKSCYVKEIGMGEKITRIIANRISPNEKLTAKKYKGAFDPEVHFQNLKFDWPPFEHVQKLFAPKSVMDIGCGLGAYLAAYMDKGIKSYGVDGADWTDLHFIAKDCYSKVDLAINLPDIQYSFELIICVEVIEHLPEMQGLFLLHYIAKSAKRGIMFSAAQPYQPGNGHITLKPQQYYIDVLRQLGWEVDILATLSVRLLSTLHWFKRNLLIFRPKNTLLPLSECNTERLHYLSVNNRSWPDQSAKTIVSHPGSKYNYSLLNGERINPMPPD